MKRMNDIYGTIEPENMNLNQKELEALKLVDREKLTKEQVLAVLPHKLEIELNQKKRVFETKKKALSTD